MEDRPTDATSRPDFWREVAIAFVMGLATLASGWSSYQSALWDGIQTFRLARMTVIGREIAVREIEIGQQRVLDLFLVERYLEAFDDGNERRADFLLTRFHPDVRTVTQSWLQSRPRDNPDVPRSPLLMKGYVPEGTRELEEKRRQLADVFSSADQANNISDNYVRLTVFFGLVMFITGISAVLKGIWPRRALVIGSAVVLAASTILLLQLPLATE